VGGAYDAEHYFVYFCEDPSESRGLRQLVRGECTQSQALVFLTPAWTLRDGSSVLCVSLRGKTTAVEDPASMTDGLPARDSAGRDGPADSGHPF